MKKILLALLTALLLIMCPVNANASEIYKKSYDINQGDYKVEINVISKYVHISDFATGYKLYDYILTGTVFYNETYYFGVQWANPEYIIQEGPQDIGIEIVGENEKVVLIYVEMTGITLPRTHLKSRWVDHPKGMSFLQHGNFSDLPNIPVFDEQTGMSVKGKTTYPNLDTGKIGTYDLEWLFTPDEPMYEPLAGTIRVEVRTPESETPDEPTTPSLTATTVKLENRTAYDINLNNKVTGSKYKWTSDNPEVAKVNAKNGLVIAVSEGETLIVCEITLPDGDVQALESFVVVGYDENAPVLTETILDLEVGNKFDINLENKIAKSKYRWVSSDRSIATVNSANGKVTTKAPGEAYVTCTITTPDNQIIVLRCDINVTELAVE